MKTLSGLVLTGSGTVCITDAFASTQFPPHKPSSRRTANGRRRRPLPDEPWQDTGIGFGEARRVQQELRMLKTE